MSNWIVVLEKTIKDSYNPERFSASIVLRADTFESAISGAKALMKDEREWVCKGVEEVKG